MTCSFISSCLSKSIQVSVHVLICARNCQTSPCPFPRTSSAGRRDTRGTASLLRIGTRSRPISATRRRVPIIHSRGRFRHQVGTGACELRPRGSATFVAARALRHSGLDEHGRIAAAQADPAHRADSAHSSPNNDGGLRTSCPTFLLRVCVVRAPRPVTARVRVIIPTERNASLVRAMVRLSRVAVAVAPSHGAE